MLITYQSYLLQLHTSRSIHAGTGTAAGNNSISNPVNQL